MSFKFKVRYISDVGENVVFSIQTACISETVSDTAKVTVDY